MMKEIEPIICRECAQKIGKYYPKTEKWDPTHKKLTKKGRVLIPRIGWFCAQSCGLKFEEKHQFNFSRNKAGEIGYYKDEEVMRLNKKADLYLGGGYLFLAIIIIGPAVWMFYDGGFTPTNLGRVLVVYLIYGVLWYIKEKESVQ